MANPPANVARLNQSHHTADAIFVDHPQIKEVYADGMVTTLADILLVISTADCTPVLLADYKNGVVGAAHAGWRGALNNIVENTLDLMLANGADKAEIKAAIGPHLMKKSFETKQDMYDQFIAINQDYSRFFSPIETGYLFDMTAFVVEKLKKYGIKDISVSDIDTYPSPDHNSYRRSCHQGTPNLVNLNYSVIRL